MDNVDSIKIKLAECNAYIYALKNEVFQFDSLACLSIIEALKKSMKDLMLLGFYPVIINEKIENVNNYDFSHYKDILKNFNKINLLNKLIENAKDDHAINIAKGQILLLKTELKDKKIGTVITKSLDIIVITEMNEEIVNFLL